MMTCHTADAGAIKATAMKLLLKQFILFALVGAAGTALHFAVLVGIVQARLAGPVAGSICGFCAGAIVNYLLNYHITFNSNGEHLPTFFKFFCIAVSGLCLNTLIMFWLTQQWHYLASQVVATGLTLVWNFLCNRFWTFKESCLAR